MINVNDYNYIFFGIMCLLLFSDLNIRIVNNSFHVEKLQNRFSNSSTYLTHEGNGLLESPSQIVVNV